MQIFNHLWTPFDLLPTFSTYDSAVQPGKAVAINKQGVIFAIQIVEL